MHFLPHRSNHIVSSVIVAILILLASCDGLFDPGDDSDQTLAAAQLLSITAKGPDGLTIDADITIDASARSASVVLKAPVDLAALTLVPGLSVGTSYTGGFVTGSEPLAPHTLTLTGEDGVSIDYLGTVSFADAVPIIDTQIIEVKLVRIDQSDIGRFMADAALWYGNIMKGNLDFAFLNAGGIRGNLVTSPLTLSEVAFAYPFANHLVVLELLGSDVQEMADHASKMAGQGGFGVPSAGFSYTASYDDLAFMKAGDSVRVGSLALDLTKTYRVAVPDFLAQDDADVANDGYAMLRNKTKLATSTATLADIVYAYAASFPAGAKPPVDAQRVTIDVTNYSLDYEYVPADDWGYAWVALGRARFFSYHQSTPTDYEFEIRLGAGVMDLPALGITLDLPPYAKLTGGWSDTETRDGTTLLVTGKDDSDTWRRIEFRGSETRTLSDLYVDTSGYTKDETVYLDGSASSAPINETEVAYAGFGSSPSGAWQQDGKLMDFLAADGTAIRHLYNNDGVEDSRRRGTWELVETETNVLSIFIDEDFDPVTRTWSVRTNPVDRKWRFSFIDGILYRGGMTRIDGSDGSTFTGRFADALYDDTLGWVKRVLEIEVDGAITFTIYALDTSANPDYEYHGDFAVDEGVWMPDPVVNYTATATGLPNMPEAGVVYDFVLADSNIPEAVDGTYQILMHDAKHIAVMPEGMSR